MIVARCDKIGKTYSKYLYLYDTAKEGLPTNRTLKTEIISDEISDNLDDDFEVKLDSYDAYIIDKSGRELSVGYSSKDLRRFFYCQLF